MAEYDVLKTQFLAAIEAHKMHPPRLRRGRDGIYHCAACVPGRWWERAVEAIRGWRRR